MIYLDYAATTPVDPTVLDAINRTTKEFIGNPNSLNGLGQKSRKLLDDATKQIADLFHIEENEITYTSSSTESNNMAILGYALQNMKYGKHIIVSKLEHPSIYAICDFLKDLGFEISYVNNDKEGIIKLDNLKMLLRPDTILVSICAVNSEIGVKQPLKLLRQVIKKENPRTVIHSDMTQAIGKTDVSLKDVDLATISSHKIFGPKGIAMLYKNKNVKIRQLIYGSGKTNFLRPSTPALPLIVGFSKALRLILTDLDKKQKYVMALNKRIVNKLSDYPDVFINNSRYSVPNIINVSLMRIKPETFIRTLDKEEIYISTNTACSDSEVSSGVMALYKNQERAMHTIRISISYLTTANEITEFLNVFDKYFNELNSLVKGIKYE